MVGSNRTPYPKCVCGHSRNKHEQMWNRWSKHPCRVINCDCEEFIESKKTKDKKGADY